MASDLRKPKVLLVVAAVVVLLLVGKLLADDSPPEITAPVSPVALASALTSPGTDLGYAVARSSTEQRAKDTKAQVVTSVGALETADRSVARSNKLLSQAAAGSSTGNAKKARLAALRAHAGIEKALRPLLGVRVAPPASRAVEEAALLLTTRQDMMSLQAEAAGGRLSFDEFKRLSSENTKSDLRHYRSMVRYVNQYNSVQKQSSRRQKRNSRRFCSVWNQWTRRLDRTVKSKSLSDTQKTVRIAAIHQKKADSMSRIRGDSVPPVLMEILKHARERALLTRTFATIEADAVSMGPAPNTDRDLAEIDLRVNELNQREFVLAQRYGLLECGQRGQK